MGSSELSPPLKTSDNNNDTLTLITGVELTSAAQQHVTQASFLSTTSQKQQQQLINY